MSVDFQNQTLINITDPIAVQDAATKNYVDTTTATTAQGALADTALQNIVENLTPQLGGQLDINGNGLGDGTNLLLDFVEDALAVNYIQIENEATGLGPTIRAAGSDINVDLHLNAKGTGEVIVGNSGNAIIGTGVGNSLTLNPDTSLILKTLTWPNADGTLGQLLSTDGAGNLAFIDHNSSPVLQNVVEDLTPQLGGDLDVNGFVIGTGGDVVVKDTLITENNNATSFRLRGPDFNSIVVQSYAGIFHNVAFAGTSSSGLQTRAIYGANIEMDLEVQGPRQIRITAVDDTQVDGQVRIAAKTNVSVHTRADAEVDSPNHVIFDRETVITTGAANTSNATVETDSGNLVLWPGRKDNDISAIVDVKTVVTLNNNLITDVADPVSDQDAVTKAYLVANSINSTTVNKSQLLTLTDAANIAWDCNLGAIAEVTITANRVLDNPTNLIAGGRYELILRQDAIGNHNLTFGSAFKWIDGDDPSFSVFGPNTIHLLKATSDGTNLYTTVSKNFG